MPKRPPGVEGRAARGWDSVQTGEGKAGWHRDVAELWGGLLGSRSWHVSARGAERMEEKGRQKKACRPGGEGWRRLKGARSKGKCLAPPCPTREAQMKETSGNH